MESRLEIGSALRQVGFEANSFQLLTAMGFSACCLLRLTAPLRLAKRVRLLPVGPKPYACNAAPRADVGKPKFPIESSHEASISKP